MQIENKSKFRCNNNYSYIIILALPILTEGISSTSMHCPITIHSEIGNCLNVNCLFHCDLDPFFTTIYSCLDVVNQYR